MIQDSRDKLAWDIWATKEKAKEDGLAEGRAEGLEKGRAEAAAKISQLQAEIERLKTFIR